MSALRTLAQSPRRRPVAVAGIVMAMLALAGGVIAFFVAGAASGSYGAAQAGTLEAGNTPGTPTLSGRSLTVSWAQNAPAFLAGQLLGANANGGYLVQRYAASGGSAIAPGAACNGSRQGAATPLSCTENGVPTGRWQYTVTPKYYSWLGGESPKSASATIAPADPSSVTLVNGGGAGNAFIDTSNASSLDFDVALPATSLSTDTITLRLTDGSLTVSATQAGTSGAGTAHFIGVDGSSLADGTITISAKATSAYGDDSPGSASLTRTKDTAGPSNSLTLVSQAPAGSSFRSGATIYYRGTGGSGGSFAIQNAVSDTSSGAASSATAALGGTTTGWTHAPGTVSTPSGGPYVSNAFAWAEGTSSSPTEVVTAADAAGNSTAAPTLTFTNDSTAPAGGSITANGGAPYNTSGTVSLSKVDFADGGSGIASNVVTRASGTLSNDVCGALSGSTVVAITGGNDPASLASGCYRYTLTGTDNVGNAATAVSAIVKVDRTPPTTPSLAFGSLSANAFYGSSFNTLYIRPSASGTFRVTAASSDADTSIQGYTFNSLNTNGGSSFGGTQTGDHFDYTFGATTTAPNTPRTVFATNNAGATSANASYGIVADTTAPTGGSVTANGGAAFNTSGTLALGKVDFGEAQSATASGLASGTNTITRASATLSNNTCGSFTGAGAVSTPTDTVPADGCYRYTLTAVDNVGNQATATSSIVKVDTVKPSTTDNSASIGNAWKNTNQTVTLTPSDAASGVAATYYTTDGSTPTTSSSQGTSVVLSATGVYTIKYFSVDNAGNQESVEAAGTQIRIDKAPPSNAIALGAAPTGASLSGTTLFYKGNAAGSFTFVDTVTDANSGAASASYPAIATTGWSHAAETVSTPSGGPYTSSTFSWTANPSSPSSKTITGTDVAGNTTGTAITFTSDTAGPSGGSVSGPAFTNSTAVALSFSAGADAAAGVNTASGQLSRAQGSYTPTTATCGSFGSFSNIGSAGPSSPYVDTVPAANACYQYRYTVSDNVGNSTTYTSGNVVVDTTAPTATNVTLSNGGSSTGVAEKGDTVVVTYGETMDASTFCSSWVNDGSAQTKNGTGGGVSVTITDGGLSDVLSSVTVSGCTFHFGSIALNANYVTSSAVFSGNGSNASAVSWNPVSRQLTITFGALSSGTVNVTPQASSTPSYTADTALKDQAGNAIGAGPFTGSSSRF